jgi:uncharacterized protein YcbK (DUF882 family)
MSITMDELLKGAKLDEQDQSIQDNLAILLERLNKVRSAWAKPMKVTSGLRTKADQLRIYTAKGIPESKIPWGSQHLKGAAADIYDPNKELQAWVQENEALMAEIGLWMEDFSVTVNWIHFQITPPKSGARFFKP